jgi:hypothetical protein
VPQHLLGRDRLAPVSFRERLEKLTLSGGTELKRFVRILSEDSDNGTVRQRFAFEQNLTSDHAS